MTWRFIRGTFEQAPLPQDRFDLAVAATSFHWVDQDAGMPKLGRIIRPGGWAAVWWTIFDDPDRQNAFRDALQARTGDSATPAGSAIPGSSWTPRPAAAIWPNGPGSPT